MVQDDPTGMHPGQSKDTSKSIGHYLDPTVQRTFGTLVYGNKCTTSLGKKEAVQIQPKQGSYKKIKVYSKYIENTILHLAQSVSSLLIELN